MVRKILFGVLFFLFIDGAQAQVPDEVDMIYARQPKENLVTGGQPSLDDLKIFAENGFGLVINLRVPGEFTEFDEAQEVEKLGMKYINIPVRNMGDLTPENAALLHEALNSSQGPVVLHCTIGMRAGGLLGVEGYLHHDLSKDEAIELGKNAHMGHVEDSIEDAIKGLGEK